MLCGKNSIFPFCCQEKIASIESDEKTKEQPCPFQSCSLSSYAYAFFFRYKTKQQAASTADTVMAPIQRLIGVSSPVFGLSFPDVPPDVDVSLPDCWLPEPEGSLPVVPEVFSVNTTLTSVPSSFTGSAR